jgi:hypothetical protein
LFPHDFTDTALLDTTGPTGVGGLAEVFTDCE